MRKILIFLSVMVISMTLTACNNQSVVTPPSFVAMSVDNTTPVSGGELYTFYKAKDDQITVQITLNNPSNVKIKSIVINGYTHFSTKFEEGSTNALIILKIDVGSSLGETIYSVDRVYYLDGENNEYVSVSNNNEFRVYVFKELPTVSRENYQLTRDQISIDFNISDVDSVILENTLIANLYAGGTLIDTQTIESGETTVTFTSLLANRLYEVKILASYDLDDSNDVQNDIVLYSEPYSTLANGLPSASITNISVSSNSVTFDVAFTDTDEVVVPGGLSVVILKNDVIVDTINISDATSGLHFDNLLNDSEYQIKVLANYDLNDGLGVNEDKLLAIHTFSTLPRQVPLPALMNLNLQENSIEFDVYINDPFSVINPSSLYAKLYLEGEYIETSDLLNYHVDFQVSNLFANKEFTIEILGDYDLNDGNGIQADQVIFTQSYNTLENAIPSVEIEEMMVTQGYITIDLFVADPNNTLMGPLDAILYEGGSAVQTVVFDRDASRIVFDYPTLSGITYYIEFYADYNLRDENGAQYNQSLRRIVSFTAEPKAPIAEIHNVIATTSTLEFDVIIIDADTTIVPNETYVYIYLEGVLVTSEVLQVGSNSILVDSLLSNNQYEIRIVSDYNLDDGSGVLQDMTLSTSYVMTETKELPSSEVIDTDQDETSIQVDVDIIDVDGVVEAGSVVAVLSHQGVEIATETLTIGENFNIQFTGLLSDNNYKVEFFADYDLNDGQGVIADYKVGEVIITTDPKQAPTATFLFADADEESITVDIRVDDPFGVITGDVRAILLLDDVPTGEEVALNVGINSNVTFTSVYAGERYYIDVVADYDLNDGESIFDDALLESEYVITAAYDQVLGTIDNIETTTHSVTFDVYVVDNSGIITGNLQAELFQGGVTTGMVVPLVVGENLDVTFDMIDSATEFTIKVLADYDANIATSPEIGVELDTADIRTNDLSAPTVAINNDIPSYESFTVDINVIDVDSTITGNLIAQLYEDGLLIDTKVLISGFNSAVLFDGLYSNYEYTVKVYTSYDLNDGAGVHDDYFLGELTVYTLAKTVPSVVESNVSITHDEVTFNVEVYDPNNVYVAQSLTVGLYINDVLITSEPLVSDSVYFDLSNFIADYPFEIRFTGDYDLNDNQGLQTDQLLTTLFFRTLAYAAPSAVIEDITPLQNTIDAIIEINDDDSTRVGAIVARLYEGAVLLDTQILVPGTNYVQFSYTAEVDVFYNIVVIADYNLRDGAGDHTDQLLSAGYLLSHNKLTPEAEINVDNVIIDATSITFDAMVYDTDATLIPLTTIAGLYLDGSMVDSIVLSVGANLAQSFIGLYSNREYEIIITTDYNNNDGNGDYTDVEMTRGTYTTVALSTPSAIILVDTITNSLLRVDITVVDPDNTLTDSIVVLKDSYGTIVDTQPLVLGLNDNITFMGLYSDEVYTVSVLVDYDLNTGSTTASNVEIATENYTTRVLGDAPTATLTINDVDVDSIDFSVTVEDNYNVITNNLRAVLYLNNVEVDSIGLSVGSNTNAFTGLDANATYLVQIETDYDLNERTGEILAEVLDFEYRTTDPVTVPEITISNVVEHYNQINLDVLVTDDDAAITGNLKAVLYKDGLAQPQEYALSVGLNSISFISLNTNTAYSIKVFADYDLRDGSPAELNHEFASEDVTTSYKWTPTATISDIDQTSSTLTVYYDLDDHDSVITSAYIRLYEGAVLVEESAIVAGAGQQYTFSELSIYTEYTVTINATYDLEDGNGVQTDEELLTEDTMTLSIIMIANETVEATANTLDVVVMDAEGILTSTTLVATLYGSGTTPVATYILTTETATTIYMFNILSNFDYSLVITATYDSGGGEVTEDVYTHEFTTSSAVVPSVQINPYSEWTFSGNVGITVTIGYDFDSVATDDSWTAYLYADGVLVDTQSIYVAAGSANPEGTYDDETETETPTVTVVTFSGYAIIGGETYTVVITADVDMNDEVGVGAVETALDSAAGLDGNE